MTGVQQVLRNLISINSVNPAYAGGQPEAAIQEYVKGYFRDRGIEVFEQQVAPGRPNVVGRVPGRDPRRRLVFEAHCDTAGVQGMTIAPFEPLVSGGRMYGRGACDTKAGLAAMMCALAEVKRPPCEIWVVSAADEEHAYTGVLRLRDGLTAAAAVVSEPTSLRVVAATKGCLRWRIVTRGKAAHSSKPHLGVNAIHAMARVLLALESDAPRLDGLRHPLVGSATFSVGLIGGGTQVNVVPEHCWIEVDRRLVPGETHEGVLAEYRELLAKLPHRIEMERPSIRDWALDTPLDAPIVRLASRIVSEAGLDGEPAGVPYGSDASKLSQAGIPSIVLGPGSIDQAHCADEYVELEQVEQALLIYRRLMERFE
ncbi:MAG: M20 family metallopeptidase [Bryobacterales bacterium]|nr:M20 family metallopeptidase [Bryobacterales bacterium]